MRDIIQVITVYGIVNIITKGAIFEGIKGKVKNDLIKQGINCVMCVGFWIGILMGTFYGPYEWWNIVLNGAYYSGTSWIINAIVLYLGGGEYPIRIVHKINSNQDEIQD
jgi:hypothetical protein